MLRKVDHLELIAGAVESAPVAAAGKSRGKKTIAAGDLADVFGIEMAEAETSALTSPSPTTAAAKKPAKPRAAASKTASKKKQLHAGSDSKKSASTVAASERAPKKPAAAHPGAVLKARVKAKAQSGSSKKHRDRRQGVKRVWLESSD